MLEGLGLVGNAVVLIASLLALSKASDLTIKNSVRVAEVTGLGRTTVGFILVAFSTSLPEFFVSEFALFQPENIGVSIGNVLGSNIMNVCLILGVCFLIIALKSPKSAYFLPSIVKEEMGGLYFGLFVASIIPLALLYIGYASQLIGGILTAVFVFYLYQLSTRRSVREEGSLGEEKQRLRGYTLMTLLGAAGVVVTSFFIVESASLIALGVGIPRVIIGATIVAFGTSLPELVTSTSAARKGHMDLALGNIVGSGFTNITLILGVSLVASPLQINMTAFSDLVVFSLMANLILWYFLSSERIGWREGAVLVMMYAFFLLISFSSHGSNA
jgi:cation:H+ antiporter